MIKCLCTSCAYDWSCRWVRVTIYMMGMNSGPLEEPFLWASRFFPLKVTGNIWWCDQRNVRLANTQNIIIYKLMSSNTTLFSRTDIMYSMRALHYVDEDDPELIFLPPTFHVLELQVVNTGIIHFKAKINSQVWVIRLEHKPGQWWIWGNCPASASREDVIHQIQGAAPGPQVYHWVSHPARSSFFGEK